MSERVLSGIQPTGPVHLGRWLGAVRNWVRLQDRFDECLYCVVDYHTLTAEPDPDLLRNRTLELAAQLLACGVDPERSTLFVQSQVPEHTELSWILECVASHGWLTRMTQYKDKAERFEHVNVGLLTYPVLQAADILIHRANRVPVGEDQVQHLELGRKIARRFNHHYGETFPAEIEPILTEAARVMSFKDPERKMSASLGPDHFLSLFASDEEIRAQVRKAVTDVGPDEGEMSPGVANLVRILRATAGPDEAARFEAAHEDGSLMYSDLKDAVAEAVCAELAPIRERREALAEDDVRAILRDGGRRARERARETLAEVREKIGLLSI